MRSMHDWLCSDETGLPFTHCVGCRMPLLETDSTWLVNKDYHHGECVLEYAICQRCRDAVTARISNESKASVREFLERRIDWAARVAEFMMSDGLEGRFSQCIACRTPRGKLDGFGISALFDSGGDLVTGPLPLLICRTCIGQMLERISEQSRREWKDFLDSHFAGPSADESGFPGLL